MWLCNRPPSLPQIIWCSGCKKLACFGKQTFSCLYFLINIHVPQLTGMLPCQSYFEVWVGETGRSGLLFEAPKPYDHLRKFFLPQARHIHIRMLATLLYITFRCLCVCCLTFSGRTLPLAPQVLRRVSLYKKWLDSPSDASDGGCYFFTSQSPLKPLITVWDIKKSPHFNMFYTQKILTLWWQK